MVKNKSYVNPDEKNLPDFKELEKQLHESDFDGHTDFLKMTFTQKLTWLSEAVVSTYLLAKDNPEAACNSFFQTQPLTAGRK